MTNLNTIVARPPSLIEAQLIVGMLESNGVVATTSADDAGGLEPQWQLTQGVRVLVAPEDESAALALIADADTGGE
jgi:hypothetical protein